MAQTLPQVGAASTSLPMVTWFATTLLANLAAPKIAESDEGVSLLRQSSAPLNKQPWQAKCVQL